MITDVVINRVSMSGRRRDTNDKFVPPHSGPVTKDDLAKLWQALGYSASGPTSQEHADMGPLNDVRMQLSGLTSRIGHWTAFNDEGDAVRHAEWAAKMARAMGERAAKAYGDAHERDDTRRAPTGEVLMDLINNHNGRVLQRKFPNKSPSDLAKWAAARGMLQVGPLIVEE